MKHFLISIILSMLSMSVLAQIPEGPECKLFGAAYDSFTRTPIVAKIILMRKDSVILDSTYTKLEGRQNRYYFTIENKQAEYMVQATCTGYKSSILNYKFSPRGKSQYHEIPTILLQKKNKDYMMDLDEVEVKATRIQLIYRGDTLVYDASAFVLPEGSMLDALIRQMPGAELRENGDVYINGKKLDYLTLNGKNFFKGKNKVMLENLPYYSVKNIKVYYKGSHENMATNRNKKDYVMDVNLKREYLHSFLGNIEAGAGTDNRWLLRMFGLLSGEHNNIGVFTNLNNVNEDRKPQADGIWTPANMNKGLKTTKQIGLNVESGTKNKLWENSFDAITEWTDYYFESRTTGEVFSSDDNIIKQSFNFSKEKNIELGLHNRLSQVTDNPAYIAINLDYHRGENRSTHEDSTYHQRWLNQNIYSDLSKYKQINADLAITKFFMLENDNDIGISAKVGYSTKKPDDLFSLNKITYTELEEIDLRKYYKDSHTHSYNYSLSLQYDYTIGSKWIITPKLTYGQRYKKALNYNYKLDLLNNLYLDELGVLPTMSQLAQVIDVDNSYKFRNQGRKYTISMEFTRRLKNGQIELYLPLAFNRERIHYNNGVGLDTLASRKYFQFEPYFLFQTFGKKHIELSYESTKTLPDFFHLMPFSNNINPLSIISNNPSLKRRREHKFRAYYDWKADSTDLDRWIDINSKIVQHAWGNRISYNSQTGGFTSMMDNVNGNWDIRGSVGFTRSIDRKNRFRLMAKLSGSYVHSVDYDVAFDSYKSVLSNVNTWNTGLSTSLKYILPNLTFVIQGGFSGRFSKSNRLNFDRINTYDYQYGANMQYNIPTIKLSIDTDITMFSRRGYESSMMNTNDLIWNVRISYSLFKGNMVAKLFVADLLHQLSNKMYTINAQGWTETCYNSIPPYLMFSLVFKRRSQKNN